MALNNEKATIEVGSEVPVGFGAAPISAAGVPSTAPVERKPATIKLIIEPFISPDSDKIRLKVDQKITEINRDAGLTAKNISDNAISLDTRTIETTILVRNGDTAVLGGLMKNSEGIEINKVPVLGDLPILGWLFKSQKKNLKKTNLIVFLTPRIVRAGVDNESLVNEKLGRRTQFIKENMGGRDPHGRDINRLLRSKKGQANVYNPNDPKNDIIDETLGGEIEGTETR